jgi:hypothetical protein
MTCFNPDTALPDPWITVLLLHWYDEAPDREPLRETGCYAGSAGFYWHNPVHNADGLDVHAWAPLPLLPERRPK